jgi:hypothetical protein
LEGENLANAKSTLLFARFFYILLKALSWQEKYFLNRDGDIFVATIQYIYEQLIDKPSSFGSWQHQLGQHALTGFFGRAYGSYSFCFHK